MSALLAFGDVVTWTVSSGVERTGIFLSVVPAGEEVKLPEGCGSSRIGFRPGTCPVERALIRTSGRDWKLFAPRLVNVSLVVRTIAEAA
jgi:hypothetical protein